MRVLVPGGVATASSTERARFRPPDGMVTVTEDDEPLDFSPNQTVVVLTIDGPIVPIFGNRYNRVRVADRPRLAGVVGGVGPPATAARFAVLLDDRSGAVSPDSDAPLRTTKCLWDDGRLTLLSDTGGPTPSVTPPHSAYWHWRGLDHYR